MPSARGYVVEAEWDAEASVWVATSEDVPGLATGADTLDALIDKLRVVIPDLLEANGLLVAEASDVIPFEVVARSQAQAHRAA